MRWRQERRGLSSLVAGHVNRRGEMRHARHTFQGKRGEVVHGGHGSCRPVGVPGPDRETDTGWDGAITIHQACVLLRQASSSSHPPRTIFLSRFYYSVFVN